MSEILQYKSLCFLYLNTCFLQVQGSFSPNFIEYILTPFSLSFIWDPYIVDGNVKDVVPEFLKTILISNKMVFCFLNFFSVYLGDFHFSRWPMHSSILFNLLLISPPEVYISHTVFFSSDWSFIIFSSSLVKFSLCWSIFYPVQLTFLLLLPWTFYQVNYLPVSLEFFQGLLFLGLLFETYSFVILFCYSLSQWNYVKLLPISVLEVCLCVGSSLCSLCVPRVFGETAGPEVSTGHVFPRVILAIIILPIHKHLFVLPSISFISVLKFSKYSVQLLRIAHFLT